MIHDFPTDAPVIKVLFSGLLNLYRGSEGEKECVKVGVHHAAPGHVFSVVVEPVSKDPGELIPPVCFQKKKGEFNRITLTVGGGRIEFFSPIESGIIDPRDISYAINLNGRDFHDGKAKFISSTSHNILAPGLFIFGGLFYTADVFGALVGEEGGTLSSKPISFVIGANLYHQHIPASLKYMDMSGSEHSIYEFDNRATYTVWISNSPPTPHPHHMHKDMHETDHFANWYNIFQELKSNGSKRRFTVRGLHSENKLTHDNPCNTILNSEPDPLP